MTRFTEYQHRLHGLSDAHLLPIDSSGQKFLMDASAVSAWQSLQGAAAAAGFDLQLVSSFRSYARQKAIFHGKACGDRAILDDNGEALDYNRLSDDERLKAIMRWSAVPGLSRHHWGTDIDVYDAAAMAREDVELVPDEVSGDGPCAALHDWLDTRIANNESFGFFRPYAQDHGGIATERWHLSYLPQAAKYQKDLSVDDVKGLWKEEGFALVPLLDSKIAELWSLYVDVSLKDQPRWVQQAFE